MSLWAPGGRYPVEGRTKRGESPARLCLAALIVLAPALSSADETRATGLVNGRVVDSASSMPLPGARVTIAGTAFATATGRDGAFRMPGVPTGTHSLVVSYLGYQEHRSEMAVSSGPNPPIEVGLRLSFSETIVITAESGVDGQARALNQQRTAPNITNIVSADQIGRFPDPNAAEAAQRIPGISIQRDQGEGRYVLIRGTEARLNSAMINGERIPSPEGDLRSVALDVIPADLLEAIEVSKSLTPDMDADAIGGAVNLVFKQAPDARRLQGSIAGGFNRDRDSYGQLVGGLTLSQRFADRKLGVLVGASARTVKRGSEDFEVTYDQGELGELQNRDYEISRRRYGLNFSVDYRASESTTFLLSGVYNHFEDTEIRHRLRHRVDGGRIVRDLKDRFVSQDIASVSFSGRRFLGAGGGELSYKLTWARAEEGRFGEQQTAFGQRGVTFRPNVTPTSIDPDDIQANPQNEDVNKFVLESIVVNDTFTSDRDLVGSIDARLPLRPSDRLTGFLKVGAKYRDKDKGRSGDARSLRISGQTFLTGVPGRDLGPVLGGRYYMGYFPDPEAAAGLAAGLPETSDRSRDAADYEASENIAAGYGLADLYLGSRLRLLCGVRYEGTSLDYHGFTVLFDPRGSYLSTQPVSDRDRYGQLLPMVHVKYGLDARTNLRAAVTRTLARPNHYDLVPYRLVRTADNTIERGNPALVPTKSWNFDLLAERYFQSVGLVSAGVFYKSLQDYIYPFTYEETVGGDRFRVMQPQNGESAHVFGLEVALETRFRSLPRPLDGLGVSLNYTFTDSEAIFPDRSGQRATLPGQARHVGNAALFYERGGLGVRASVNFHGQYVDLVASTPGEDRYYDDHVQLDVTASRTLSKNLNLYVELVNLTNEPLRYYRGVPNRPDQEEYYRWWGVFGFKLSF